MGQPVHSIVADGGHGNIDDNYINLLNLDVTLTMDICANLLNLGVT